MASLLFGCTVVSAEETRVGFKVIYRVNSCLIDPDLGDNSAALSHAVAYIDSLSQTETTALRGIVFLGFASPEGPQKVNERLSDRRLEALRTYICGCTGIADSLVAVRREVFDWNQLRGLAEASVHLPCRDAVLSAIDSVPEMARTARLKTLGGGSAWRYMRRHMFPSLRNAVCIVISAESSAKSETADSVGAAVVAVDTVPSVPFVPVAEVSVNPDIQKQRMTDSRRPFYMSLSTNMLFDALLVPNIGAEFYLGRNITVGADWMYGWWDSNRRHRYWRVYGGELSARYWFGRAAGRKPLTGHHVGIYAQALIYDFEFGGKGQMAGKPGASLWESCNGGFGIDYGYSLPLTPRFNIDFTIGIGYLGGKYYDYHPVDNHYVWQSTRQRRWFGPTRARISLVWLPGNGNRNAKGGGR